MCGQHRDVGVDAVVGVGERLRRAASVAVADQTRAVLGLRDHYGVGHLLAEEEQPAVAGGEAGLEEVRGQQQDRTDDTSREQRERRAGPPSPSAAASAAFATTSATNAPRMPSQRRRPKPTASEPRMEPSRVGEVGDADPPPEAPERFDRRAASSKPSGAQRAVSRAEIARGYRTKAGGPSASEERA